MADTFAPISENTSSASLSGLQCPEIIVPSAGINLYKWAVIACDQHTTDYSYWQKAADEVGDNPSTLHLILPEIYLEQDAFPVEKQIRQINRNMRHYLESGILHKLEPGCIVVDRSTPLHPSRKGLIIAIDLDEYDFQPGNSKLIRATEGTVLERIPPRVAIRQDALLELPHVQLLFDDPEHKVIDPLWSALTGRDSEPLYATSLMQDGGAVRGWFCPAADPFLNRALQALFELETRRNHGLLFVVGDGNHSLATAKSHWEAIKDRVPANHPARYALVEAINIHDPGLEFEPIHRIVFTGEHERLTDAARAHFADMGYHLQTGSDMPQPAGNDFSFTYSHETCYFSATQENPHLAAGAVQEWLDQIIRQEKLKIDYVHGVQTVADLVSRGNLGILLPAMAKEDFFPSIIKDGILPRKTFSMGSAFEKRYYMECRLIR